VCVCEVSKRGNVQHMELIKELICVLLSEEYQVSEVCDVIQVCVCVCPVVL